MRFFVCCVMSLSTQSLLIQFHTLHSIIIVIISGGPIIYFQPASYPHFDVSPSDKFSNYSGIIRIWIIELFLSITTFHIGIIYDGHWTEMVEAVKITILSDELLTNLLEEQSKMTKKLNVIKKY